MVDVVYPDARILIVDDEPANVLLLERLLRGAGYANLHGISDPREAVALAYHHPPDLILLDLHMPHLDGLAVMEQLSPLLRTETYLPVLVLTADTTPQAKQRALSSGAKDFLTKPFDVMEVLLRTANLIESRFLHLQLRDQNDLLEQRVRERTAEVEDSRLEMLERLARIAEVRDDNTHRHTIRVGELSARLAERLNRPADEVEMIRRAAPLHDIGKVGVSDRLLLKPGRFTPEEFREMQEHTRIGAQILGHGRSDLIRMAEELALTHHERWDGGGYPTGLRGRDIPLVSRIVSVADVYDALRHVRPYKPAWTVEDTLAEIARQRGRQFDPDVVDAFLPLADRQTERE